MPVMLDPRMFAVATGNTHAELRGDDPARKQDTARKLLACKTWLREASKEPYMSPMQRKRLEFLSAAVAVQMNLLEGVRGDAGGEDED